MGIGAKIVALAVLCLFVFTPQGRDILHSSVDWASDAPGEWSAQKIEDSLEQQQLQEQLRDIEPVCGTDSPPGGFSVSEGHAIALVVRGREIDCERVTSEPMLDAGWWSVHIEAGKPDGCEFGADVDATTAEVTKSFKNC